MDLTTKDLTEIRYFVFNWRKADSNESKCSGVDLIFIIIDNIITELFKYVKIYCRWVNFIISIRELFL